LTAPAGAADDKHFKRVAAWQKHLSTGVMDVTVFVNPAGSHFDRVVQAVEIINAAQTYYRLKCVLDNTGQILKTKGRSRSAQILRRLINGRLDNRLVIAITEHDLQEEGSEGNVTMSEAPGCTLISCDDWVEFDDAPPTRVYLVYQLTSALTTFAGCLTETENDIMMHQSEDDTDEDEEEADFLKGCLFDYWFGPKLLYRSMVSARLCPKCRSALLAHGTPPEAVNATEKLLDWVRSVILERERKLPKKIFIGHGGKSNAWQELRSMLRDWDLDTEEFNEEPTAGISITQRLKSMLENSRFAFLVMTSENLDDHGRWQARLNVIHEIGLFQGRLGTECAIVLRDKSVSTFSNLDGITRMDFEKDQITTLRGEIHRLLIARGVIPADVKPDQKR
jgi:hypothetical protein